MTTMHPSAGADAPMPSQLTLDYSLRSHGEVLAHLRAEIGRLRSMVGPLMSPADPSPSSLLAAAPGAQSEHIERLEGQSNEVREMIGTIQEMCHRLDLDEPAPPEEAKTGPDYETRLA